MLARGTLDSAGPPKARTEHVTVLSASHWRMECALAPGSTTLSQRLAPAAEIVAAQAAAIASRHPDLSFEHLICSTYLSQAFTSIAERTEGFRETVQAATGRDITAIIHTYECAGWGYALRFLADHSGETHVMLSIVDLDLCEFVWTEHHPLIGHSGFGVTTLLLTLPADWSARGLCDGPYPDSGFRNFVRALRDYTPPPGAPPIFAPFFRQDLRAICERMIGAEALAPDRQERYGHCFGSDPWIGLIEWVQADPAHRDETVTLGSLAYNGYFSICPVTVPSDVWVDFRIFTEAAPFVPTAPSPRLAPALSGSN